MRWSFFILLAIVFLLFVPIPIVIKLSFIDNKLSMYIFKFKVKLHKKENKKTVDKKGKLSSIKEKLKDKVSLSDISLIIHKINCNRFKPTLRIYIDLNYGLFDASSTGITYGVLNTFPPFMNQLLSLVFKVRKFDLKVKPDFNRLMLDTTVKSIIFINLAKIIYMILLIIKVFKLIKDKKAYACSNA